MTNFLILFTLINFNFSAVSSAQISKLQSDSGYTFVGGELKQEPFGEINLAPLKQIKAIIRRLFMIYQREKPNLPMKFSIDASFNIEEDGVFSKTKIVKTSGSKIIDQAALEVLSSISESHVFAMFSALSSTTIRFELTEKSARLVFSGVASSQSEAEQYSQRVRTLLSLISEYQNHPAITELVSLSRASSHDMHFEYDLTVGRARAGEIIQLWLSKETR